MPPKMPLNAMKLEFPLSLSTYTDYAEAQKAVDYLADEEFPVQNLMIVGTELKQIERVTGRLTYPRVASAGALSGAWFGLFIGLLIGIFAEDGQWWSTVLTGIVLGLAFGIVWAILGYAATGGRRDFTSVSQVIATKYEVLVEHKFLARAQELLTKQPGRPVDL
ncbi:MAG: rane protein [Nocardioidaceae bacterium]|nr:rane protein [Nocardioidaceae bacterium]